MTAFDLQLVAPVADVSDVYRQHQTVWSVLARYGIQHGHEFLYHWVAGPRAATVSVRASRRLPIAKPARLPLAGSLCVALLCASRTVEGRYVPVEDSRAVSWACELFARNGIALSDVDVGAPQEKVGQKAAHRIVLPVRTVAARYTVTDRALAWYAFTHGIGRARRFGCGLIQVVARAH